MMMIGASAVLRVAIMFCGMTPIAFAYSPGSDEAISYWAKQFKHSTLTQSEVITELEWFRDRSVKFKGKMIRSAAEGIKTHQWERDVLAKAFYEITGVRVEHSIKGEGTIVDSLMQQLTTGQSIYDIYVSDADLIGTHMRIDGTVNLTRYMKQEGRKFTNPKLDLSDFMNLEFSQDEQGNQLQLPDQQFANLYWFRHDWFTRKDIKKKFTEFTRVKYGAAGGYELGVPLNWAAYEDIAEFFTNTRIDGKKVYGHLDYGKKSPSLGWRFTDSWLAIAGVGDKGLPNGSPVDEWGIRVEKNIPAGSSMSRGGATNSPAAVYALQTYIDWLKRYAPPEALNWRWEDAGPKAARGDIAQRVFQYITWLSDESFTHKDSPMLDANGMPVWRVAPTPHGRYWSKGMKAGYQDAGSWTIPKSIKGSKRNAAWLWAQFCVSKSVSVDKFLAGGTPVRLSTLRSTYVQENKKKWGGIVEFYTSDQESQWTDTGLNVPHYPLMSKVWWPQISLAIKGTQTAKQSMDNIALQQDSILGKLRMTRLSPKLNGKRSEEYWLANPGAPKPEQVRSTPKTIPYDQLIKQWQ
ncbi:MAG: ABC transporter substrate-binding protein [Oleispira sp.]